MPNHVVNEIIFRNVSPDIQESILKKILKDGYVDFGILVPPPLNIWQGDIGEKEESAFGKKTWYKWNTENWGTKWNAYGQDDRGVKSVSRTGDTLTLIFQTAWSPPRGWICALFNAAQLPFEHNYLNEGDSEGRIAKYFFKGEGELHAPVWEESKSDAEMYRHLHILLWGCEPESLSDDE
jgi:hypothetical protein